MFPYRRLPSHITGLYIFTVANFLILCHIALVQGDITVLSIKTNETVETEIPDMPAYFGAHIDEDGIWGQVVYAEPANACLPIAPPPRHKAINLPELRWFVLIERYGCDFSRKVLTAQEAGYDAAIVHNVGSNQLEPMGPNKDLIITIPSMFIGESDGLRIKKLYTYEKGFVLYVSNDFPDIFWSINLDKYLLPFACVLALCFLATMSTMVVKCIRDRRHLQRHRLPARMLKKLPIKKFKKGDHDDICAICLEDYVEGEKLRVLPCSHTYHIKCIDPWLTESRRTCPVCKRKVLPRQSRRRRGSSMDSAPAASDSSSDGESDAGARAPSNANESTPLLAAASSNSSGGANDSSSSTIRGHTNRGLMVDDDDDDDERHAAGAPQPRAINDGSAYQSIPDSNEDSSASSGGWYQSFATPPHGSPITFHAPPSHSSAAGGRVQSLRDGATASTSSSIVDLLSSGEHSLNGDCVDFEPIDEWFKEGPSTSVGAQQKRRSDGPVEIAIDVGRQVALRDEVAPPELEASTSSSSASSQNSQRPISAGATAAPRQSRRSRRNRSKDHDMVV